MIDEGTVDVDQAALTGESTAESHNKGILSIQDRRLRAVRRQEPSPPQVPEATLGVRQSWYERPALPAILNSFCSLLCAIL
jgi:hypothetical protein